MSKQCPNNHRGMWLIAGGNWCWCYECGAVRTNPPQYKRQPWYYPTGIGGENPANTEAHEKDWQRIKEANNA